MIIPHWASTQALWPSSRETTLVFSDNIREKGDPRTQPIKEDMRVQEEGEVTLLWLAPVPSLWALPRAAYVLSMSACLRCEPRINSWLQRHCPFQLEDHIHQQDDLKVSYWFNIMIFDLMGAET